MQTSSAGNQFAPPPVAADFDSDGKPDLATVGGGKLFVFRGAGDGTFTTMTTIPIAQQTAGVIPRDLATGDFDGDGHADIAVISDLYTYGELVITGSTNVQVFYGNGDGTFRTAVIAYQSSNNFSLLDAHDMDGDGLDDLILSAGGGSALPDAVTLVHAQPGRTFGPESNFEAGYSSGIHVADLNHDGYPDLLVTSGFSGGYNNVATVLLNPGGRPPVTGTVKATPEPSALGNAFQVDAIFVPADDAMLAGTATLLIDGAAAGTASINSNTATFPGPATLAKGTHTLTVQWPGDATHAPAVLTGSHVVTGLSTLMTLTGDKPLPNAGDSIHLTATLSTSGTGGIGANGTVSLASDGAALSSAALVSTPLPFTTQAPTAPLTRGSHSFTATYSGDANYAPASATLQISVGGLATMTTLSANPTTAYVGATVSLTANIAEASACTVCTRGGAVEFFDAGVSLGTAPLSASGAAMLSVSFTAVRDHALTAVYSGDTFRLPSTSAAVTVHVIRADTALGLSSSVNPSTFPDSVTISVHLAVVAPATAGPAGSVVLQDGAATLATLPLDGAGNASFVLQSPAAGTHTITASFAQTATLNASSAVLQQVVQLEGATVTVATSPSPGYTSQTETLTAIVAGNAGTSATGTVQFFDGSNPVGTAMLAGGQAVLPVKGLSAGLHSITAAYGGDSRLKAATSTPLPLTILLSDFTLSADPASVTVQAEHHVTFKVNITSLGAFTDRIAVSAGTLPSPGTLTVNGSPASLAAGGTQTVTVTVETDAVREFKSSVDRAVGRTTLALCVFPLLLLRRKRRPGAILLIVLTLSGLFAVIGCGSKYPASLAPGTYSIQLQGQAATLGVTHTVSVPLVVTK